MTDAFQRMVADLGGPTRPADGRRRALVVARAAEHLRKSGDPELQVLAAGLRSWLTRGGDLERALGLRPGRGRCDQHAARAHRRQAMVADMVRLLDLAEVPPARRAAAAASVVRENPVVAVIMRVETGARPPTSRGAWVRILRAAES